MNDSLYQISHNYVMRKPTSAVDRIQDYFVEMKNEYDVGGIYSVYVILLDPQIKSKWNARRKKSAFPREKYQNLETSGLITFQDCVYVGYTGIDLRERYQQHIKGINSQNKIVMDFPYSKKFEEGMWEQEFLMTGIGTQEEAMMLESWYGWALYQAGWFVWGPHYHREKNFLNKMPFW